MENRNLIRWFVLLFAIFEYCLTCNSQRHALSVMLFFIICWLVKGLYTSYNETNIPNGNNGYSYGGYDYDYYGEYRPKTYNGWQTTNKPYVSSYEIVNKMVMKSIKPNMHIVLDTQEKTVSMNNKKTKYLEDIEKIEIAKQEITTVSKPQLLLPPPKETNIKQTTEPSIIIITNSKEIDTIRKNVYNSIINYLKKTFKTDGDVLKILDCITYIDVVQETRSAFIYVKNIKVFNEKLNNVNDLINFIKTDSDMNGVVSVDEYQSLTISDYFSTCKGK